MEKITTFLYVLYHVLIYHYHCFYLSGCSIGLNETLHALKNNIARLKLPMMFKWNDFQPLNK